MGARLILDIAVANSVSSFESISYTISLIYCVIFDPPPLFQPRVEKKFRPPHLVSQPPHLKKNFDPHLLLDNSNTAYVCMLHVCVCMHRHQSWGWGSRPIRFWDGGRGGVAECSCAGPD